MNIKNVSLTLVMISIVACDDPSYEDCEPAFVDERGAACSDDEVATLTIGEPCLPLESNLEFIARRLQLFWYATPYGICAFDTDAGLGANGGCGVASGALWCPVDGHIYFDYSFFRGQLAQFGDFAIVTILAHEWGHLNQTSIEGIGGRFDGMSKEDHADCQAGVFAAFEQDAGHLDDGDLSEAFGSLCALGTPLGVFDPADHGTCEERVAAFRVGYESAVGHSAQLCEQDPFKVALDICGGFMPMTCE
jgi:hypothetical protein